MKLEIYKYPDTTADELTEHFSSQYGAECQLSEEEITEEFESSGVYTLEFLQSDAERILEKPVQYLVDNDETSEIRIRHTIRAVLFQCDRKIVERMVTKTLPADLVDYSEQQGDLKVLVVFKKAEDAAKVVGSGEPYKVTSKLSATVSFYGLPSELHSAEVHMEERQAGAYGGSSANSSLNLDIDLPSEHRCQPLTRQHPDRAPDPSTRHRNLSHDRPPSPSLQLKHTSEGQPKTQSYTCIEIEKGMDEQPETVYEVLKEHLKDVFDDDTSDSMENRWKPTIYEQSYDEAKEIFRFDANPSEVRQLIAQGTQYFDEDNIETAMKITPLSLEPMIGVRVMSNKTDMTLSEKDLMDAFGTESRYLNDVQIKKLDKKAGAVLLMDSVSVAALVVSTGLHTLTSAMTVEASFHLDLHSPVPKLTKKANVLVTFKQAVSDVLLKKFKLKSPGKCQRNDDRSIIVNFEREEDAEKLVQDGELPFRNMIREVTFYEEPSNQSESPLPADMPSTVKITMDDKLPEIMLQKWMEKIEGTVERIDDQNFQIKFNDVQEAERMARERQVEFMGRKGVAEFYEAPPKANPTHLEITCKLSADPIVLHSLIDGHLSEGGLTSTIFEQSYDESKNVYRFDTKQEDDVASLLESKQLLLKDKPDSEIGITDKYTDKKIVMKKSDTKKLRLKHVNAYLGPDGVFKSDVTILAHTEDQALLEMNTYSVASKLVSIRDHVLPNGAKVEITYVGCEDPDSESGSDDSDSDNPQGSIAEEITGSPTKSTAGSNRRGDVPTGTETLLIYNLLDVNEITLFYWVKAVTGVWPLSIHLSMDEEKAVVKVPLVHEGLDERALQRKITDEGLHIRGQTLAIMKVQPSNSIQVFVTAKNGVSVDETLVKNQFCDRNPSMSPGKITVDKHDDNFFTMTFPSDNQVAAILSRKYHQQFGYEFAVAEYHQGIGLCKPDGFKEFNHFNRDPSEETTLATSLTIRNAPLSDVYLDTLKMKMQDRKRTRGDEIKTFSPSGKAGTGFGNVRIVYVDESVAERVYNLHAREPIKVNGAELDMELELPKLNDCHDEMGVRLSELSPDLDPEKLRLYIAALSDRTVSDLSFDRTRTRAVASFSEIIDFASILRESYQFELDECPDLRIQQENKPDHLLAVGSGLSKDNIEQNLERFLKGTADPGPDYQVVAESVEGTPDKWKIKIGSKVLAKVNLRDIQQRLIGCTHLSLFADFLGLHVTTGIYKKTAKLSDFIYDKRVDDFLMNENKPAGSKLAEYITNLGFTLTTDGIITVKLTDDKKRNRQYLQNWRHLDKHVADFVTEHCAIFETESLTEQIFSHVDERMAELTKTMNIEALMDAGHQLDEKRVWIIGDRNTVENVEARINKEIEEKRSKIKEDASIRPMTIPNVCDYQISYLEKTNFFKEMEASFNLRDIKPEKEDERVTLEGTPAALDEFQNRMLDILPKMKRSRCQVNVKPLFLKVFDTKSASDKLESTLDKEDVTAVWTVANKTISSYSETKQKSKIAMDCLFDVVWEGQYPSENKVLEDLELNLLTTQDWEDKKGELELVANPLFIELNVESNQLNFAGLKAHQNHVLEEIKGFFEQNVIRKETFCGKGKCVTFMWNFRHSKIKGLEKEFSVEIKQGESPETLKISGTRNAIADTKRALRSEHDDVKKGDFMVKSQAKVQYITENQNILSNVEKIYSCVVAIRGEEASSDTSAGIEFDNANFRTILSTGGTECIVQMGDITEIPCDAIVNPANEDLEHAGGAAAAIARAGGQSIQQECRRHIRNHGRLMVGGVMSSGAGSLPCKKVIHAVGPKWSNYEITDDGVYVLENCIENCFMEMKDLGFSSIAIPPISTGIFGFPLDLAVRTIVKTIRRLDKKRALPKKIVLIDNKQDSLRLFERELRSGTGSMVESPRTTRSTTNQRADDRQRQVAASSTVTKYSVSGKMVNILGRTSLEVITGDITDRQDQSVVNSVGKDMNLSNGKVAPVMLKKAGPQLQRDCNALKPIQNGEVKPTDAYNMAPCKKILHCCLPEYKASGNLQGLQKVVSSCLTLAEREGHTSIAFPALGTGNLNYPEQDVARCMINTTIEYISTNTSSCIRDVKIVVFHLDNKTQRGFDAVLESMKASGPAPTQANLNAGQRNTVKSDFSKDTPLKQIGATTINNTQLRLLKGSIIESDAEVIVNSTDRKLSMAGQVAQALLNRAGPAVVQEISELQNELPNHGIWVSKGGNLQAEFIFHLDTDGPRQKPASWPDAVAACLSACENRNLTSIALPALGTGRNNLPEKVMAKAILEGVGKYLSSSRQTVLETIDIVVFKPEMVQSFEKAIQAAINEKSRGGKSMFAKISSLVSSWMKTGVDSGQAESYASFSGWKDQCEFEDLPEDGAFSTAANGMTAANGNEEICDDLTLDIYAGNHSDIDKCKMQLDNELSRAVITEIWADKMTYPEDKLLIADLDIHTITSLEAEAERLHVQLDINTGLRNIKIWGLPSSVSKMSDLITRKLRDMQNMQREQEDEHRVAKHIQWRYTGGIDGEWIDFGIRANKLIEDEFSSNRRTTFDCELQDGSEVTINLKEMTADFGQQDKFDILRADIGEEKGIAKAAPVPNTWAKPFDEYRNFLVTPGSPEFLQVKENFERTIGDRKYQGILEVQRVQNPTLYQMYLTQKKHVAKKWKKKEEEIERVPLWHGTDELTAPKILKGKFDRGFASQANAAYFGNGVYFARDTSYSAHPKYAKPNANGEKLIMQCRVIVGAEVIKGEEGRKAAPYKDGAIQYDCVVDDVGNPSVFVSFSDAGAYPEYIIKFR